MSEFFQFAAVILLILIWLSVRKVSTKIGLHAASLGAHVEQLDERLKDIEERLRDNFQTDEERQAEVDRQP